MSNSGNVTIGKRLIYSFSFILVLVVIQGMISIKQSNILWTQIESLYSYSLRVRQAVSNIENNILGMRVDTRDIILTTDKQELDSLVANLDKKEVLIEQNFKILYQSYSYDQADINAAFRAYELWNRQRKRNLALALNKNVGLFNDITGKDGYSGHLRSDMLNKLEKISNNARLLAIKLHDESSSVSEKLFIWITVDLLIFTLFVVLIGIYLTRKFRSPVEELKAVVVAFRQGNLSIRSKNRSKDEIGLLAESFNEMLDFIETEKGTNNKSQRISESMLLDEDAHLFFQSIMKALSVETDSQAGAVYQLNTEKSEYECLFSFGVSGIKKLVFNETELEGELGVAVSQGKIVFTNNIPENTRFVFKTTYGDIIPQGMVTMPVTINGSVQVIITLASIKPYELLHQKLLNKIYEELSARIRSVLANSEVRRTSQQLFEQNSLLEHQRNELNIQAGRLEQQNAELELQKERLRDVNRLKTSLLSNMSHELRTPLNSIISLSGVLNRNIKDKLNEDQQEFLDIIERNGRNLLELINSILDMSRIESGKEEVSVTSFCPGQLIDEIISMMKPQSIERNNILKTQSSDYRLKMLSDSIKVRHILQNIISNAVKFTENGVITISWELKDDDVLIIVSDTGIGIKPEYQKIIFDEFIQVDSSTSKRFGGTGLGLSIAQKYARILGGDINVSSQQGEGTIFEISLPVVFPGFNYSSDNQLNGRGGAEVLIINENDVLYNQIADFLKVADFMVINSNKLKDALKYLEIGKPDIIILDWTMADSYYHEILQKSVLIEKIVDIPLLVISSEQILPEKMTFLKHHHVFQLTKKENLKKDNLLLTVREMLAIV